MFLHVLCSLVSSSFGRSRYHMATHCYFLHSYPLKLKTKSFYYRSYSNDSSSDNEDGNDNDNHKILIQNYDSTRQEKLKLFLKEFESSIKERKLNEEKEYKVSNYNQTIYKLLEEKKADIFKEGNPRIKEDLEALELMIEQQSVQFDQETIFKSSFTLVELLTKDKAICARDYLKDHLPDECLFYLNMLKEYTIECCIIHVLGTLFNHLKDINQVRLSTFIDHLEMHIVTQFILLDKIDNKIEDVSYYELKYLKLDDYVRFKLFEEKKAKGKSQATTKVRNYLLGKKLVEFLTARGIISILNKGNENVNYKTKGYKDNLLFVECAFDINLLPIKLNLPMVCPPVDWKCVKKDHKPKYMSDIKGGYLVGATGEFYNRFQLLTSKNIDNFFLSFNSNPEPLLICLTFLQNQEFRINKVFLEFIKDNRSALEEVGLLMDQCLANVSILKVYDLLTEMFYRDDLKVNIKGFFRLDELKTIINKRMQQARYEEFIFLLANAYADYPFYLPAFLDFRGRIYRSGVLHFHERDLAKSLILFSNSQEDIDQIRHFDKNIIDSGVYNLMFATGFKYKKFINYNDSYEWVLDEFLPNKDNILEFARKADDPFQFLSKAISLIEINKELISGEIYNSNSKIRFDLNEIPVSQDASASAYQLMSYLLLNKDMAKSTNMIPVCEDKIQDLYSSLKDELVQYLIHRKCNSNPQCLHFVKTQIDRKFVKRLFMPIIYGKTVMSMTNDIKQHSEMKLPYKAYFKIANDCHEFWKIKYPDIVNLMKMLNLVGWFKSYMNKAVVYGHVLYNTHQFYTKSIKTQISIYDRKTKKRHRVTLKIPTPERDIRKSQVSTCVNFIHQRDAYIAMLVVMNLKEKYSSASIYTVHDNFITSPYYANMIKFHDDNTTDDRTIKSNCLSIPSEYTRSFINMSNPLFIVKQFITNNLIQEESISYINNETYYKINLIDLLHLINKKGNNEVKRKYLLYMDHLRKKVGSNILLLPDEYILKEKKIIYDEFGKTLGNYIEDLPYDKESYIFDREDFRHFLRIKRDMYCHTKLEKKTWDEKSNVFLSCYDEYFNNVTIDKWKSYRDALHHKIDLYPKYFNYSLHY